MSRRHANRLARIEAALRMAFVLGPAVPPEPPPLQPPTPPLPKPREDR